MSHDVWKAEALAAKYLDGIRGAIPLAEEQVKWLDEIGYKNSDCFFKIFELALFGGCK